MGVNWISKSMKKSFKFVKRIFVKTNKNTNAKDERNGSGNTKEDKTNDEDTCINFIVEKYLNNSYIDIPLIPNFVEKHIYRAIFKGVFDFAKNDLNALEFTAWNHVISFDITPQVIKSLIETKNVGITTKEKVEERERDFSYIHLLVEQFLNTEQIDIPGIPRFVEMAIYKNILILIFNVFEDVITSTSIEFMGHSFQVSSKVINNDDEIDQKGDMKRDQKQIDELIEAMKSREPIIDGMVEKIMENDIFLLPDFVERRIYKTGLSILFFFLCKVVNDMKLKVFMQTVDIRIDVPSN